MILIFNLPGLLIGAAGVAVGLLAAGATGRLWVGLIVIGWAWLLFGRGRRDPETNLRGTAPSLFFIPLFYLAFPVLLLAIPAMITEGRKGGVQSDTRSTRLNEAESTLNRLKLSGDGNLAGAVFDALEPIARDPGMHVFAAKGQGRALVLVKLPDLKETSDTERVKLLDAAAGVLADREETGDLSPFIGLQGRFVYGAIRTPTGTQVKSTVPESALLDYYGPRPSASPVVAKPAG